MLKGALVGVSLVVISMMASDWLRLRRERGMMVAQVQDAIRLSEIRGHDVDQCLATLQQSRWTLDTAHIAYLSRIQTNEDLEKKWEAESMLKTVKKQATKPVPED